MPSQDNNVSSFVFSFASHSYFLLNASFWTFNLSMEPVPEEGYQKYVNVFEALGRTNSAGDTLIDWANEVQNCFPKLDFNFKFLHLDYTFSWPVFQVWG